MAVAQLECHGMPRKKFGERIKKEGKEEGRERKKKRRRHWNKKAGDKKDWGRRGRKRHRRE